MSAGARGLPYCRGRFKRAVDVLLSALALLLLSPVLAILVVALLVVDGRPVLFAQERVGMNGSIFTILKFRTMRPGRSGGLSITARGDDRITQMGRLLRAAKLDELPQLLNVLSGNMSIVGPRPELERYVGCYSEKQRRVLDVRPGLTDPATLRFRDEESILGAVASSERESYYVREIMPKKLELNLEYIDRASPGLDFLLIMRTLAAIAFPPKQ